MATLEAYGEPDALPASESARIGRLLGISAERGLDDIGLAERVAHGLQVASADALARIVGTGFVSGALIPEATLRRARKEKKALSREMSERLYEIGRVVDAASRAYHGDSSAIVRFLNAPHPMLAGRSPLDMAQSSSAGAEAVINLLRRAGAGFAL